MGWAVTTKKGEIVMSIEQEHKKLTNIAARLAACLWDFHGTCPECGNYRTQHMPGCAQIYERDFKGPHDTEAVFVKAFGIMTPNVEVSRNQQRPQHDE
jgi:hypothetical protein